MKKSTQRLAFSIMIVVIGLIFARGVFQKKGEIVTIPEEFVGVVESRVYADVDFNEDFKKNKPTDCGNEVIVPVGCIGTWNESLPPGTYRINKDYNVTLIDTGIKTWKFR